MALVRVLSPFVARVVIANALQVKAIAHAHVKTDKIDAGVLASLHAAGFLPEVWRGELDDAGNAETLLRNLARHFEKDWEGVSVSILEGLDEMLTVTNLGLPEKGAVCKIKYKLLRL